MTSYVFNPLNYGSEPASCWRSLKPAEVVNENLIVILSTYEKIG